MPYSLDSDFILYGGIKKEGKRDYAFTGRQVATGWDDYPYAVTARICHDSFSGKKKMMSAGDPCIVFFHPTGKTLMLPLVDWTVNIHEPEELGRLVTELKNYKVVQARIGTKK